MINGSKISSLRKQPSIFAPGLSGVSREGRLRFHTDDAGHER